MKTRKQQRQGLSVLQPISLRRSPNNANASDHCLIKLWSNSLINLDSKQMPLVLPSLKLALAISNANLYIRHSAGLGRKL